MIDLLDLLHRLGPGLRRLGQDARAAHAGIQLDLHLHNHPFLQRPAGELPGRLQLLDGLGDPIVRKHAGIFRVRIAQHQYGGGYPAFPQFHGFRQAGHPKGVRPRRLQALGAGHRTMAIGIRLHHAHDHLPRLFFYIIQIMPQRL